MAERELASLSKDELRYLKRMGLSVRQKPNGRPLVNRNHYDAVMGCAGADTGHANGLVWGVH